MALKDFWVKQSKTHDESFIAAVIKRFEVFVTPG